MKKLPEEKQSFQELFSLLNGALKSRLLLLGLELGVFDRLGEASSAEAAARQLELHPGNTAKFLDALAVIGLLEKKNGLYRNRPSNQAFLVRDSPTHVGDLFLLYWEMCLSGLERAAELIRRGPGATPTDHDLAAPETWAKWSRAGAQWAFGFMGGTIAGLVSRLPGFSGFQKMLDLGGGHGVFTLYIVQAHPTMRGVVLDQAAVLETAEALGRRFEFGSRIETRPGDYLQDHIGDDYDLIFASSTLNTAKDRIDELFDQAYRALKPGGYFLCLQDGLTDERTKPETMLGHLIHSLETEKDLIFDQGFLAEAMLRAGFRQVRSRTMETPMGPLDLDVGRK
ncbi:MAG: class I SAM-dependent methyltransferase [Pseudomonadota bacterium]